MYAGRERFFGREQSGANVIAGVRRSARVVGGKIYAIPVRQSTEVGQRAGEFDGPAFRVGCGNAQSAHVDRDQQSFICIRHDFSFPF